MGAEEEGEGRRHEGLEIAEKEEAERGDVEKVMKLESEEEIKDFLLYHKRFAEAYQEYVAVRSSLLQG